MRINATQIKVGMTMYYFNNIYIYIYIYICRRGGRNQGEVFGEWKKERERIRGR